MSRSEPITARSLADLMVLAVENGRFDLIDPIPASTVKAVMKACPDARNEAWDNYENSQ